MWPLGGKENNPDAVAAELTPGGRVSGGLNELTIETEDPSKGPRVHLTGWVMHPTRPIDAVRVSVNGVRVGESGVLLREDCAKASPAIPHARDSGFDVRGPAPDVSGAITRVVAEGLFQGALVGTFHGYRLLGGSQEWELPPSAMMKRVSGTESAPWFRTIGLQVACDLMTQVDKHLGIAHVRTLLDFGCGSGRVARFLLQLWPQIALSGCDIDAQAVAWSNANLKAGAFKATGVSPPLPYADNSFDAVVGVSVMTHLTLPQQHAWLAEMKRIVRPGGLFLPSIHGAFAALLHPEVVPQLAAERFIDTDDHALDGIAPPGYYRNTFQLPSFTRAEWSKHFAVVDMLQAGCGGYQDFVVLRKR